MRHAQMNHFFTFSQPLYSCPSTYASALVLASAPVQGMDQGLIGHLQELFGADFGGAADTGSYATSIAYLASLKAVHPCADDLAEEATCPVCLLAFEEQSLVGMWCPSAPS